MNIIILHDDRIMSVVNWLLSGHKCQAIVKIYSLSRVGRIANKFILINSCDAIGQMRFSDRKHISVVHRLCCHRNFLHLHPSTLSNVQQNFANITFMKKIHFHGMKTMVNYKERWKLNKVNTYKTFSKLS